MTTNHPALLRSDRDGIATLTLNRPQQRNALSRALIAELHEALNQIAADPAVRLVVLAAEGPAFCSGHDLKEIRANTEPTFYETLFSACSAMMLAIVKLPQPVIARVHATATAAGCQLVASCDLAIAADGAQFATPGVNIGLFCSTPMVAVSRNLPRKHVMEMLLTGEAIDAATAARLGLINRAVPAGRLDAEVARIAGLIVAKSPLTLKIGKEAFYRQLEMGQAEAYSYASAVMARNMATRDAAEGIDAFLAKRQPSWCGA
jgi:enoyl-CoA hydratase/carnithine racemase